MEEIIEAQIAPQVASDPDILPALLPELPAYLEKDIQQLQSDQALVDQLGTSKFCRNFSADEKAAFLRAFRASGGSFTRACEVISARYATVWHHLSIDREWSQQLSYLKLAMGEKVESFSYKMALTPRGVTDRMAQLKRFFPSVYRNNDQPIQVGIAINLGNGRG